MKLLQRPQDSSAGIRQEPLLRVGQVACAVALSLLVACGSDDPAIAIGKIRQQIDAGQSREAVIGLKSLLQAQPDIAEARLLLGRLHLTSGDPLNAEAELRRAITAGTPKHEVAPLLARALLESGRAAAVIEEFDRLEPAGNAGWVELKALLAEACARTGQQSRANALLDEVLRRDPAHAPALLTRARLQAGAGQADSALQLVEGVLQRDGRQLGALGLKGDILAFAKRDLEAAIPVYAAAVQVAPSRVDTRSALISALLLAQKVDEAARQLAELKTLAPQNLQTRSFEAHLAHVRKDYVQARDIATQLLKFAPDSVELMELAGSAELHLGAWQKAEVLLGKAVFIEPKRVRSRQLLARALIAGGRPEKALATLRPLLDGGDAPMEIQLVGAEALLLMGQLDKAAPLFAQAAKARPDDSRLKTVIALLDASKHGSPDQAITALGAIAAASEDTSADMALFSLHMQRRSFAEALEVAQGLERKDARSPTPLMLQAQVHGARDDAAATRRSLETALQRSPKHFAAVAGLAMLEVRAGKPEDAWKRIDAFVASDPTVEPAWLTLAGLAGQFPDALARQAQVLDRALAAVPASVELGVLRVDLLLRERKAKAALAAAQALRSAHPQRADVLEALGQAQMAAGDLQQAQRTYADLVLLVPKSAVAQMRHSDALRLTGDMPGALRAARKAADLAAVNDPAPMTALIALAVQAKQPEVAMQAIREQKRRAPDDALPFVYEGDLLMAMKQTEAALATYRAGTGLRRNPTMAAVRLHANLVQAKRTADAQSFAESWVRKQPRDVAFLSHLGDVALHARDYAEAESRFRSVLALQPTNARAMNNVSWSVLRQGKPGALELARAAAGREPANPRYADTLALALADAGEQKQAIELLTGVVERHPGEHEIRLHLAQLLVKARETDRARSHLDALDKQGSRVVNREELARLRAQIGS